MAKNMVPTPRKNALPQKKQMPVPAKLVWDLPQIPDDHAASFAFSGSQVNTDLAVAADCESHLDYLVIPGDDDIATDLLASPMVAQLVAQYENERDVFDASAQDNIPYALLQLIQRAYMAGLYSPVRLAPKSTADRATAWARHDESARLLTEVRRG